MYLEALLFLMFATMILGGGLVALFHRSVVHSAFALMATFFGVAGIYLLLGFDFLAVTQVLIYVGGILVLYLFGLMLTPPDPSERKMGRIIPALIVCGGIGFLAATKVASVAGWLAKERAELPDPEPAVVDLGTAFLQKDGYIIPFELAAVVLLLALVGSVFIARRQKETT